MPHGRIQASMVANRMRHAMMEWRVSATAMRSTISSLGTVDVSLPLRSQELVRRCTLASRSRPITLNPPQAKKRLGKVAVRAILASEATPQPKGEPMEWLLFTTLPTSDVNHVIDRVHWYTCTWTIEVWQRVLKTGCRIESRQLETVERLAVALTRYSIIAWRILFATIPARAGAGNHAAHAGAGGVMDC